MHRMMCIVTAVSIGLLTTSISGQSISSDSLTLDIAVIRAIEYNPELKILREEINVLEATKLQSSLMPNPELGIEAENILGSNEFSGFKGSEITALISQDILLAGKISKREKVAEMDVTLAEWDYEEKRLEVITEVRKAFANAILVQKLIEKNRELIKISEEFILNLNERVKAGKISPAEVSRAKIILNSLQIELTKLETEYYASISKLEALIYDPNLIITTLGETTEYPLEALDYDSLIIQLENNPSIRRYESEYSKQEALIDLEESKSIPDLTISAGYKRLNEIRANTFVLGASIPIPIFDRNQGSIQEAQIRLDQKKTEYELVKNKLMLRLNILYNKLRSIINIAQLLKKESLPEAEESFKTIKEGNMVGRFAILDVLDAERTLFEIQNQYLSTISEMYSLRIEIEGLIAREIK